jgi:hypothetical protein
MKSHVAIDAALRDPQLLGAALGDLRSWAMWVATLTAAFGERLSKREREAFAKVAGDREPPSKRVRELWAVIGRRSGKSRMASALAVFLATLTDCRSKLAKGEQGVVLVLAPSVDQAKVIFDYARGFIEASPLLASQLEGEPTATDLRLRGGVTIACRPNNFRTVRGRTLLAAIFDECAYWRDETSALPDVETYRAVLPALATTNGLLIGIGSPYRKTGLLHQKHRDHYGVEGDDVLCVTGESRTFNPMLDPAVIEQAERDDPEAAASEWRAEFRSDLASLLDDAVIDGAIDHARPLELPPRYGVTYHAFTDASAGRHDAFALCVGHVEKDHFIADVLRATRPPFDPGIVAGEYAALAKDYRCRKITGDCFAGEWVAQAFRDAGMIYATSPLPKSGLYLEAVPWFNRGAVRISDHPALLRELRLLERRVHRSGRDSVDHPRNGSDDLANALVGALHLAVTAARRGQMIVGFCPSLIAPDAGEGCIISDTERTRDRIRLVHVDEHGNLLTADQVCALRHGELPDRTAR